MTIKGTLWPKPDERRLLGRFYLSHGVGELFNLIWPFQFAYLFMVMDRPEWAVLPLFFESGVMLIMQIPSGAWADRFSRRKTVVLGNLISAAAIATVPFAAQYPGKTQLVAVISCFAVWGLGQAMTSGASEAWAVDNLLLAGRRDLVADYFARTSSFLSLGAAGAGISALILLVYLEISRSILDGLWYCAAFGLLISVSIQLTIDEQRSLKSMPETPAPPPSWAAMIALGVKLFRRSRVLLLFAIALIIASFPEAVTDDAFDMSLITKGMDARGLAPLGVIDNVFAMVAPLLGIAMMKKFGVDRILVLFLVVPALAVSVLFFTTQLWIVVVLYLMLDFFDCIWDSVADTHLQSLLSSETRATVTSLVNHAGGLAELTGIAMFAWLLGEHGDQLSVIVPDLVEAFSTTQQTVVAAPLTQFGLPVPDLAIVVFVFAALLALPFILASTRHSAEPT